MTGLLVHNNPVPAALHPAIAEPTAGAHLLPSMQHPGPIFSMPIQLGGSSGLEQQPYKLLVMSEQQYQMLLQQQAQPLVQQQKQAVACAPVVQQNSGGAASSATTNTTLARASPTRELISSAPTKVASQKPAGDPSRSGLNSLLAAIDATQAVERAAEARAGMQVKRPSPASADEQGAKRIRPTSSNHNTGTASPTNPSRPSSAAGDHSSCSTREQPGAGQGSRPEVLSTFSRPSAGGALVNQPPSAITAVQVAVPAPEPHATQAWGYHTTQHQGVAAHTSLKPSAGSDDESNCSGQTGTSARHVGQQQPQVVQQQLPCVPGPGQQHPAVTFQQQPHHHHHVNTLEQLAAILNGASQHPAQQRLVAPAGVQPYMVPGQQVLAQQPQQQMAQQQQQMLMDIQGLQLLAQHNPSMLQMALQAPQHPAWSQHGSQLIVAGRHTQLAPQTQPHYHMPGTTDLQQPSLGMYGGFTQQQPPHLMMPGQGLLVHAPPHQPMMMAADVNRRLGSSQGGGVPMVQPGMMGTHGLCWQPASGSDVESALQEVLQVMLHKPRGRPVKYIDLGINRMALKYHVGVKLNGRVESVGATDTELAAQMLLDMVKIGLGLYTPAAAAAAPGPDTHPEEQMIAHLAHPPSIYSTSFVQRVVAQLINRSLVTTSELSHAYTRAHAAGCAPAQCFTSVAAALLHNA